MNLGDNGSALDENTHYTGTVNVEKIVITLGGTPNRRRDVREVVRISLKANSLGALKRKIAEHIALVEED